jgi:hypothetical protein
MVEVSQGAGPAREGPAILTALVIGSANTLAEDKARALSLFEPDLVIGCNHAARDEPGRIDHWATMHPDLFKLWVPGREAQGLAPAGAYWHARHRIPWDGIESRPIESWGGSSGLLCVAVAYELGCERIVIAGVPMHKHAQHYDIEKDWNEARQYWPAWERWEPRMRGRVKSMSGWTRNLLGEPTQEWIDGRIA